MNKNDFETLVNQITERLYEMCNEIKDPRFSRNSSPSNFEQLVVEASEYVIKESHLDCVIDYNEGSHAFPDITYTFNNEVCHGIEVKSSTQAYASPNSWTILGNSIVGNTRINVEALFVIFIKVGDNGCFIKSANYEDSVSDVVVTHSPRYKLNLAQPLEDSFFYKSGISYDDLKTSENPINLITDYFREEGLTAWWITDSAPSVIKNWSELDNEVISKILAQSFVLFPEIIYSSGTDKYKRLSKWLVAKYSVVDTSLRDKFTAGGKVSLSFGDTTFENIPRVFSTFHSLSDQFLNQLYTLPSEDLEQFWKNYNFTSDSSENRLTYWKNTVLSGFSNTPKDREFTDCIDAILNEVLRP